MLQRAWILTVFAWTATLPAGAEVTLPALFTDHMVIQRGLPVHVSAPEGSAVRYAWADNPAVNLYNGAGLPAVPFRSGP